MKKTEILICDKDKDYLEAFVSFLMSVKSGDGLGTNILGVSEIEEINKLQGSFDIGFISPDFEQEINRCKDVRINRFISLSEEACDLDKGLYKYQDMSFVLGILSNEKRQMSLNNGVVDDATVSTIGIYSPGKHELSLPFALCVCKLLKDREDVLFIDLSEIGILRNLLSEVSREDLIDVIYMLENGEVKGGIERYITAFEGFSVLSPVAIPSQLSYVTPEQWFKLFEFLNHAGFKRIVIFFGNLVQGFGEIASRMEKLLVLNRPGDYYSIASSVFMDFIDRLELRGICQELDLPMSASNLTAGGFRLDALISGKLYDFVREEARL